MAPTHMKRFVAFREKEKLYHYALVPTVSSLFKEPHMRSYTYFGSVGILYSFFSSLSLHWGFFPPFYIVHVHPFCCCVLVFISSPFRHIDAVPMYTLIFDGQCYSAYREHTLIILMQWHQQIKPKIKVQSMYT